MSITNILIGICAVAVLVIIFAIPSILYEQGPTTKTDENNEDFLDRILNKIDKKSAKKRHEDLERMRKEGTYWEDISDRMNKTGK